MVCKQAFMWELLSGHAHPEKKGTPSLAECKMEMCTHSSAWEESWDGIPGSGLVEDPGKWTFCGTQWGLLRTKNLLASSRKDGSGPETSQDMASSIIKCHEILKIGQLGLHVIFRVNI